MRKRGLRYLQLFQQNTGTLFAASEHIENHKPVFIAERFENASVAQIFAFQINTSL
jgi:hypothetical protein